MVAGVVVAFFVAAIAAAIAAVIDAWRIAARFRAARTAIESSAPESLSSWQRCEYCRGTGLDDPRVQGDWCPHCHGTGAVVAYLDGAEDTAVEHIDPDPEDRAHDRYIDEQNGVL